MSTFLHQQLDRENQPPKTRLWYGTIAKTVGDFVDLAEVIIPDWDPTRTWGGCRWMSRDAVTLPQKGDECIVALDSRNQPWILAWWPFS